MEWVIPYIGLPFKEFGRDMTGCDCWGLVRILYQDRFKIELPSYADRYAGCVDTQGLPKLIDAESSAWDEVIPGQEREGDVIVFRMRGVAMHTGFVVRPGVMLHVYEGIDAVIEDYNRSRHWNGRILGIFRHESQAN